MKEESFLIILHSVLTSFQNSQMVTKHTSDTTTSLIEQKETKILMNAEILHCICNSAMSSS